MLTFSPTFYNKPLKKISRHMNITAFNVEKQATICCCSKPLFKTVRDYSNFGHCGGSYKITRDKIISSKCLQVRTNRDNEICKVLAQQKVISTSSHIIRLCPICRIAYVNGTKRARLHLLHNISFISIA